MCGIAGFIDPHVKGQAQDDLIASMLFRIAHRGPDYRGTWKKNEVVLGHNRLKIIDLSDDANQPMEYQGCQIIFNGEVYNYIEVRKKLEERGYRFATKSDTEVILAAYKCWGADCVKEFVGMWAFAIWDEAKNELFCSRDRFGIKPFYYIHSGDKFYFGSEYKAFETVPVFNKEFNYNQIHRGLTLGWSEYYDESYYSQLKCLPASFNLTFKKDKIAITRYWDIDPNAPEKKMSREEKNDTFYNLFRDSIQIHSRSDVSLGGCLSGGLDSSSIAAMYGTLFPESKFKTFTTYYEGSNNVDERNFVYEVVNKYRNIEPHYFSPTDQNIKDTFDKVQHFSDLPLSGSSYISQYFLMDLAAKNGVVVVLDGQGSDEFLGGYMHTFHRIAGGQMRKLDFFGAIKTLVRHRLEHGMKHREALVSGMKSVYSAVFKEEDVYKHEYGKVFDFLPADARRDENAVRFPRHFEDLTHDFLYHLLFGTSLPTLLHYEDRNSMAFSLESRVPFLDHRLVEFSFALPLEDKVSPRAETKKILRESLSGILPDAITHRKDKKGFVTPGENQWLRGPLRHLLESNFEALHWMDVKKVRVLMDEYKAGNNKDSKLVWRLATLNHWMKQEGG